MGVKGLGYEADHSIPSTAEVKHAWSYISTPLICLHGVLLIKHRNFSLDVVIRTVVRKVQVTAPDNLSTGGPRTSNAQHIRSQLHYIAVILHCV
jgi:hypothetical protein